MSPTHYWRQESHEIADSITYGVLIMVITVIVWLFDRQMKKALKKAHESEIELMKERDELELKVEERTAQVIGLEAEKMNQLYRLAEFGRLSSGVFHDLINPLTAVSLNLEQIQNGNTQNINDVKEYLCQAVTASHKMEDLIACIKKSLRQESSKTNFSLHEEINSIIKILDFKTRRAGVKLSFKFDESITLYGDPVKFSQIVINLLSNSIDACETKNDTLEKIITIYLSIVDNYIVLKVCDPGEGISNDNIDKIFQPFFSTKKSGKGLGLGLSSTKNIVENEFQGSINVESTPGLNTIFTIRIPSYAN